MGIEAKTLEVRDVMTPRVVTADEETPLTKVSTEMEVAGIGSVVITRQGKPVGIVTERDIALNVIMKDRMPSEVKVKEVMSSPLVTIDPFASVEKACELLAEKRIRRLPVVEAEAEGDRLVGIISVRNILTRNPTSVTKFYYEGS
ncbi:CBS domain-containing protein [ANME-1 cluster archaeon ex4572_4]|nr:MAG: CBS domain-containing protein [ANME-1 cluster archaeon ex4572_4]PXF50296.1 MAG: CBS domain-containing protein [Methanophagales archaeon]